MDHPTAADYPAYRYGDPACRELAPFADLASLARDILARRHRRGLRLVDLYTCWENPEAVGDRAMVRVHFLDPDGEPEETLTAITAGESAADLIEACRAQAALRKARAA